MNAWIYSTERQLRLCCLFPVGWERCHSWPCSTVHAIIHEKFSDRVIFDRQINKAGVFSVKIDGQDKVHCFIQRQRVTHAFITWQTELMQPLSMSWHECLLIYLQLGSGCFIHTIKNKSDIAIRHSMCQVWPIAIFVTDIYPQLVRQGVKHMHHILLNQL